MWILLFLAVIFLYYYSNRKLNYFQSKGVSTLPPYPYFGNLTSVTFGMKNFVDIISDGYKTFKDERYFGIYQYHVPTLVAKDPELIRQILIKDFNVFPDRGIHIDPECDPLFGYNLINLRGSPWREMRAALTPAFSGARFRSMTPLMAECTKSVINHLKLMVGSGKEIQTDSIVSPYLNDVIASCAFGFSVDSLDDPGNCLFKLGQTALIKDTTQVMKFFGHSNFPSLMKLLGVRLISKSDTDTFKKLFKSALQSRRDKTSAIRPDFIQTLVESSQDNTKPDSSDADNSVKESHKNELKNLTKKFSDEELVSQAVLFFVAGYDTTSNLINFFLHEMAENPQIQEKVRAEIDSSYEESNIYESIQKMDYLDMCINETLRKWPVLGSFDRSAASSYDFGPISPKNSGKSFVGAPGLHIWLPTFCLHRDEKYWPNPELFDPDRFSADRKSEIVPYTYFPFGNGPRYCLGSRFALMAAKVFVVQYLRNLRVNVGKFTPKPIKLAPLAFVLRPSVPFSLFVQPRC